MSIYVAGFGAGVAVSYSLYRYIQNLKQSNGITVEALACQMHLKRRYSLVLLADAEVTSEFDPVLAELDACILTLVPQRREGCISFCADGEETETGGGILIEGTPGHRDEVVVELFESLRGRKVILDAMDRLSRIRACDATHITTAAELRELLIQITPDGSPTSLV